MAAPIRLRRSVLFLPGANPRALEKARDAFMTVLEDYTLGDLVKPRARLAGLLGISEAGAQG